jgi:hypothetical protein
MKKHLTSLGRIYRLKLVITGILLLLLGVLAALLADWLDETSASHLIIALVRGLSDVMLVTGAIGLAVDFFTGRDNEAADLERARSVLKELTPEFTDAVVKGFAVDPDDLRRVASPELLDDIAANVLALRLGDAQFAREIYQDVRDLAIRAPERWYDVDVSIRLSAMAERDTSGVPLLDVLVSWEYTVTPSHPVQRFACTSDLDEFHELVSDVPATSTWFLTPRPDLDASQPGSFELLSFSVDGMERPIRRSARKSGQTYTASIGEDVVHAARPVRIRHTYRTVADATNHRLFLAISTPARDVSIEVDYSASSISRMSVTDLISSARRPYVSQLPTQAVGKELTIDVPGWVQAGTGFTFVWTLASENPAANFASPPMPAVPGPRRRVGAGRRSTTHHS